MQQRRSAYPPNHSSTTVAASFCYTDSLSFQLPFRRDSLLGAAADVQSTLLPDLLLPAAYASGRQRASPSIRRSGSSTLQKSWLHFRCFRFGICPFVHLSVSHCFHFAAALFLVSDKFLLKFFFPQHYTVPSVFALIVCYFLLHLLLGCCSASFWHLKFLKVYVLLFLLLLLL